MSHGPRVAFLRFASREALKLEPWREHCRMVTGSPPIISEAPDESDGVTIVSWQLISSNNRTLARSARLYTSLHLAEERVGRIIAARDRIETHLVSEDLRGMHGWWASISGIAIMTCSRLYLTERDRNQSAELAIASLPLAVVQHGARLLVPARELSR
jgi:hypothetical protein